MTDDEPSTRWVVGARLWALVGFLAALLSLVLPPSVGVACDRDTGGPVHVCYTGWQLVTASPSMDMRDIVTPDGTSLRGPIVNTLGLPTAARVLAATVLVTVVVGVASTLLPQPTWRLAVATGAASVASVLLVVTAIVATSGLSEGAEQAPSLFVGTAVRPGGPVGVDDVVGTNVGFWLVLPILLLVAVVSGLTLAHLRFAELERQMRLPGDDYPMAG